MRILTPTVTKALIHSLSIGGYLERAKDYPVSAELSDSFLFIMYDSNSGDFIISKYYKTAQDYRAEPYSTHESMASAVEAFCALYQEQLNKL